MKIIDLLNKIANGEEVPRKFTYNGYLWEYDINNQMWFYYFGEGKNHRFDRLFYLNMCLNDEVEIIEEEKEIEFDNFSSYTYNVGRVDESNIEEYIHTLFSQQMRLIENQKKIIEELKNLKEEK